MISNLHPIMACAGALLSVGIALGDALPATVVVDWDRTVAISKSHVSVQVCVEAPLRRESPIHDRLFKGLKDLNADYARLQPWYPYPRLAVAELEPPDATGTHWDFFEMDRIMADFMEAVAHKPVVMNISTIPQWMFVTPQRVAYPSDPNQITWTYEQGVELRDPTMKEVADYFARVAAWYIKGGFTDERGKWHQSGHRYRFDYWEVLNEPDYEHHMTPELYTAIYDEVVSAVRKVDPRMKFMGPGLDGALYSNPRFISYFLDPRNHKPGIPVDMISYHFYASPGSNEPPDVQQHTFFGQADEFIRVVGYVEEIRRRLSPTTGTNINEVGSIPVAWPDANTERFAALIPKSYWNLSAAVFAYLFANLARLGIDIISAAELIDYPGQAAGAELVDPGTGEPNIRYRVVKLLRDRFPPGDRIVDTRAEIPVAKDVKAPPARDYLFAQGFLSRDGRRKVLLVNKRNWEVDVRLPDAGGASLEVVSSLQLETRQVKNGIVRLPAFAVAVVELAGQGQPQASVRPD